MKSLLFVPGDKPQRFEKALSSGASYIIIDLEDAVNEEDKQISRENILQFSKENLDKKFIIRINDTSSAFFKDDVKLIENLPNLKAVMLPKAQDENDILKLANFSLIPIIESAKGVHNLSKIASCNNVKALSFGALDMRLDLNLSGGAGEEFMLNFIRSQMSIISKVYNLLPPINGVYPDIKNELGLKKDMEFAKSLGFSSALCIHPSQVSIINEVFSPTDEEIKWAENILNLAKIHNNSVFKFEGKMIDLPVILKAKQILS